MKKKVAIISGAASGIGKHTAERFIESDIQVFALDVNQVSIAGVIWYQCDVSSESEVIKCVEKISEMTDHVDYLINAAGILCYSGRYRIEELPLSEWEKLFEINLKSVFLMTKYVIPLLKKSENGNVINFSSEQVTLIKKKSVPYSITKAAVEMFTKVVALELLENKIRANTIALASVKTNFIGAYIKNDNMMRDMMEKAEMDMPFGLIKTDDVYSLIQYLTMENCKVTGQTLLIDSGVVLNAR